MPKFKVVIERNRGIHGVNERLLNPFRPINIFDPNLKMRVERRTWPELEAKNEAAVRAFFKKAQAEGHESVVGFTIASIEKLP